MSVKDAALSRTLTLPAGGATALSTSIDTGNRSNVGMWAGDAEAIIEGPALTTVQLPNGESITYSIVQSDSADLSAPTPIATFGAQTGAGGVGAAGVRFLYRLPSQFSRYIGLRAVASASAAATGVTASLSFQAR